MKETALRAPALALVVTALFSVGGGFSDPGVLPLLIEFPGKREGRFAPGIVRVERSEQIDAVRLHIPVANALAVYTRVNAVASGTIQSVSVRRDEVVCDLNLGLYAGRYAFEPGTNTVEVKVVAEAGEEPVHASWAIVPEEKNRPPDSGSEIREQQLVAAPDGTEAPIASSLTMLSQYGTDQTEPLQADLATYAPRLLVRGRLDREAHNVILRRVREGPTKSGSDEVRRSPSPGASRSYDLGFEVGIGLEPGVNDLELLVGNGRTGVRRYSFKVVQRGDGRPEEFSGRRWAVIVGISDYRHNEDGLTDLEYSDRDARAVRDFLLSPEGGSFPLERIQVLLNEHATAEAIRTAFFTFLARTQPEDLVIVYFSGHGTPDPYDPGNHYLLAHDSRPPALGGTAIPMRDVRSLMDHTVRAKRVLFLADACHSGGAITARGARSAGRLNFVNKYLESLAREEGRLVLTASRADEFSFEHEKWGDGHGAFTYTLLEGLKGQADRNGDRIVTAGEVLDHVQLRVPDLTAGRQHPSYREQGFNRAFPLANLGPAAR